MNVLLFSVRRATFCFKTLDIRNKIVLKRLNRNQFQALVHNNCKLVVKSFVLVCEYIQKMCIRDSCATETVSQVY